MKNQSDKSHSELKILFHGNQHQIDASVLINNLVHTTSIIHELNNNLNSGKKIDIKIKAHQQGNFLIHIDLIETTIDSLKNLYTKANLDVSRIIISSIVELIKLKIFLKGQIPKSLVENENKTTIENEDGNFITIDRFVYNQYDNNIVVKEALTESFIAIENDISIIGFEITDKKENSLIKVDKEDFVYLSKKTEEINYDEKIIVTAATLNILRISFEQKLKWEFYLRGLKITAKIEDPSFQLRIDNGESFAKGDVLEVELIIKQKFDKLVNTYINKSYKIDKIKKHIKRVKQPELDFS